MASARLPEGRPWRWKSRWDHSWRAVLFPGAVRIAGSAHEGYTAALALFPLIMLFVLAFFLVPLAAEAQQAGKWMARLGIDAGSSARNAALGFARVPPHTDMAWEARHGRQPKGVPLGRRLDLQEGERSDHLPTSRK